MLDRKTKEETGKKKCGGLRIESKERNLKITGEKDA